MTTLKSWSKNQYEVSLESTDGELCYPSSFLTSSGFDIGFRENYVVFNPIIIETCYDQEHFKDLIDYLLDLSASRVMDNSCKEKRFDMIIDPSTYAENPSKGPSYCAHDCNLTHFKFLDVDRVNCHEDSRIHLTLVPHYISSFTSEETTEDAIG